MLTDAEVKWRLLIGVCKDLKTRTKNHERKLTTHQTRFTVATVTRHAVQHGESRQQPKKITDNSKKIKTANGNHHRQYRHRNQHRPIDLQRCE